jgi:hypothetical protein
MRKLKTKVLEPTERISELLFGLVIVLTLSCVVLANPPILGLSSFFLPLFP